MTMLNVGGPAPEIYPTHLDVINGVFHRRLKAHRHGAHPLDRSIFIWFPHVSKNQSENDFPTEWKNILSANETEIKEYWPKNDKRALRKVQYYQNMTRYVFAHFLNTAGYRFLGAFEYANCNMTEGYTTYRRVLTSIQPAKFYRD